jgi:hypothetical protein
MRLGFNDRFDSYAANISNPPQPGKWFMFDKVRYGTHGNTMRFPVYWWLVQPNNQYENNLAAYYHDVKEQADAYQIKLIPFLLECPGWAREAPGLNYPSGSYVGQFGAFGRMVLDYFGSSLCAIEVWNEPNKTALPVPMSCSGSAPITTHRVRCRSWAGHWPSAPDRRGRTTSTTSIHSATRGI